MNIINLLKKTLTVAVTKTAAIASKLLQQLRAIAKRPLYENIELLKQQLTVLYPRVKAWAVRFAKNYIVGSPDETLEQKIKRSVFHKVSLLAVAVVLSVAMIVTMTAAWHSNVIQTTGLVFDVEEWGLDSSVNISSELKTASPGERGEIALEVYNSSDGIIDVELSINKTSLYNDIADMRKRLYFYIDDSKSVNGETTPRVYLNSAERYSYTVLAKQTLYVSKQGGGAPLMWEWVYDVLGYYFQGTVTPSAPAQITEYLRPVEYDFNSATFNGDALVTANGKSVQQFITDISATDGFAGTVTTSVTDSDGRVYYPVSVDANGSGIWIYCCSLSEIEQESKIDTALATTQDAQNRRFETMLNVVATQKTLTATDVSTEAELKAALADDTHNMITLLSDVKITEKIDITTEKIIDLGGNTLSTDLTATAIAAAEGSSLTVMNGDIKANSDHSGALITATGSDVAFSGVDIYGVADAIWITDQNSKAGDTRMNITDCTITCSDSGVFIKGNGPVTYANTYLNIENSTIISTGSYGVVGNGSAGATGNWGTDIRIKNSTLQATYSGIYHPQRNSTLLVESSTVKGLTPVAVKGGSVTINNSQIYATDTDDAAQYIEVGRINPNGYANTGAGVYVETGYTAPCDVTLTGNNIVTSRYSDAVLMFEEGNANYTISIQGGTYSSDVSAYVANGYACTQNGSGQYVVTGATP